MIVLGAGPNGATAALNLKRANPRLKVAIVDGNLVPGQVFRNFGCFTWINSPEAPAFSAHEFVGLPIAARDLLAPGTLQNGPYFVRPTLIGDLTELAVMACGADCWMNTTVQRIRPVAGVGLQLDTAEPGLPLTADRVLVTSGLGQTPLPNTPQGLTPPAVEAFDHLTARATRLVRMNHPLPASARNAFMAPYAGKTIAIVGAGDAANNLAECAAGFAPPELYGKDASDRSQPGTPYGPGLREPGGPASVLWVNQKALDGNAFKAANKPRYRSTLPGVFDRFQVTAERMTAVQALPGGGARLFLQQPATGAARQVDVDYVWTCTGYEPQSSPLMTHLWQDTRAAGEAFPHWRSRLQAVRGAIQVTAPGPHKGAVVTTTIGLRLPPPLDAVYLGGTSAGVLATPAELQDYTITKNGASMNANLPRAASLGSHLASLDGYQPAQVPALPEPPPLPPLATGPQTSPWSEDLILDDTPPALGYPLLGGLPPDPAQRKAYLEIALGSWLSRTLRGHAVPSPFSFKVTALGHSGHGQQVRASAEGLDALQAAALAKAFAQAPQYLRLALIEAGHQPVGSRALILEVQAGQGVDPSRIRVRFGQP